MLGVVAPRLNGVVGNGSADDSRAINTMIARASEIWFFAGTYRIAADMTAAANKTIVFHSGAQLKPDSGIKATILGPVTAPPNVQIFDLSAGGTVRGPRRVTPENFGAANNASGNDAPSINAANDSIYFGANNGAVGPSILELLPGPGYRVTEPVTLRPDSRNSLRVLGAGATCCGFIAASGGAGFPRGVITVRGESSGTEASRMNFRLADFFVRGETNNFSAQGITLGTAGNDISAATRRSVIEGVFINQMSVGLGWYGARQIDVVGGAIWLPRYSITGAANSGGTIRLTLDNVAGLGNGMSVDVWGIDGVSAANGTWTIANLGAGGATIDLSGSTWGASAFTGAGGAAAVPAAAIGILVDHNSAGEFAGDCNVFDVDIVGGTNGPGGIGIRFRSEHPGGSNIAGWRMRPIFYALRYGIRATTANGGTMGDHWLLDGTQADNFGALLDYRGGGVGAKRIAQIRIGDVYVTGPRQSVCTLIGGTAEEIADVRINGLRVRGLTAGAANRFVTAQNVLMINITDNQIVSAEGRGGASELILLQDVDHAVVANNTVAPDGIAGAVLNLVTLTGTTDDVVITGNSARQAVSNILNNAAQAQNCSVGRNLPTGGEV